MRRRTFISTLGVGAVTAIAGCGGTDSSPDGATADTRDTPSRAGGTPSGESEMETSESESDATSQEEIPPSGDDSYNSYPFTILTPEQQSLLSENSAFDGFDDLRGDGPVTVTQGRSESVQFDKLGIWIDVGQTVRFRTGGYNYVDNPTVSHAPYSTDRFLSADHDAAEFSHTFQNAGVYFYTNDNTSNAIYGCIVVGRPE